MPDRRPPGQLAVGVLAGGLLGSLLLVVSQFMSLFHTHITARRGPIAAASVGSEHAWAILPIAALAAFMAWGAWAAGSRPALLAEGLLGAAGMVIALAHDLSVAHRSGLRTVAGHYVLAANTPAAGLYVEVAGALLLLLACLAGFLLSPAPGRRAPSRRIRPAGRSAR